MNTRRTKGKNPNPGSTEFNIEADVKPVIFHSIACFMIGTTPFAGNWIGGIPMFAPGVFLALTGR